MREDKSEAKNEIVQMAILLFIVNYSVKNFGTTASVIVLAILILFVLMLIFE